MYGKNGKMPHCHWQYVFFYLYFCRKRRRFAKRHVTATGIKYTRDKKTSL